LGLQFRSIRTGSFYLDTESFKAANRDALSGNWRTHKVFLRDFDTSYLINANRALSHAFLLSAFLSGRSWQELS